MDLHVRQRHTYNRIPSYNHISYYIILYDYYFLCILCMYAGPLNNFYPVGVRIDRKKFPNFFYYFFQNQLQDHFEILYILSLRNPPENFFLIMLVFSVVQINYFCFKENYDGQIFHTNICNI